MNPIMFMFPMTFWALFLLCFSLARLSVLVARHTLLVCRSIRMMKHVPVCTSCSSCEAMRFSTRDGWLIRCAMAHDTKRLPEGFSVHHCTSRTKMHYNEDDKRCTEGA